MNEHFVFVYGTLLRGQSRFGIASLIDVVHEEAELKGFDMLEVGGLGGFPALIPGEGTVKGEVHSFKTFDELDLIEGYRKESPEDSLYLREKVVVSVSGRKMGVSTYVLSKVGELARSSYRSIASGDWLEYRRVNPASRSS